MITAPEIMPDEWWNGYLERLSAINGYQKPVNLFQKLRQRKPELRHKNITTIVSSLLDQSVEQVVWQHSLIPALRAITDHLPQQKHGDPRYPTFIRILSTASMRETTQVCRQCIEEDHDYWGFAYLRRSHQLDGVDWCAKHRGVLTSIASDGSYLNVLETDFIDSQECLSDNTSDHPVIARFLEIMDSLSMGKQPISAEHASWVLCQQAKSKGIRVSAKGKEPPLSDLALDPTLPKNWLIKHFPLLANKTKGIFVPAIDGVCIFRFQNHNVSHFVLGAALLFDQADHALNALIDPSEQAKPIVRQMIRRNANFWQSDAILSLYIKHAGSCKAITDEIGGNYEHNRQNLIANGLPPISGLSRNLLTAISDYHAGVALNEIARYLASEANKLRKLLSHTDNRFHMAFGLIQDQLNTNLTAKISRLSQRSKQPKRILPTASVSL